MRVGKEVRRIVSQKVQMNFLGLPPSDRVSSESTVLTLSMRSKQSPKLRIPAPASAKSTVPCH